MKEGQVRSGEVRPYLHVLLFVFDPGESSAELLDHVLQLVVTGLLLALISGVTGGIS